MQDITKIAEQLNAKVTQLNNERSRQLGMQEAAKKQYENAVSAYETKYGVKLTEHNLQEEYNKVYAGVKGKVLVLQESVQSIERGDYKNVERPSDLDLEPNIAPVLPQREPVIIGEIRESSALPMDAVLKPQSLVESTADIMFGSSEKGQAMVQNFGIPYGSEVVNPAPIVNPINVSEDNDKPFWETATPTVAPVVQPTINFGGVSQEVPAFGGTPLNLGLDNSFDEEEDFDYVDESDLPTPPVQAPVEPLIEDEESEEDVITPDGWGLPKTDDINKNFQDILGQKGVKFGE